jgi:hypothetical protein
VEPEQPKPDVIAPEQPKPDVVEPEHPKPDVVEPEHPKPDVIAPEQPKPDVVEPEQPKPDVIAPEQPKPDVVEQPKPDEQPSVDKEIDAGVTEHTTHVPSSFSSPDHSTHQISTEGSSVQTTTALPDQTTTGYVSTTASVYVTANDTTTAVYKSTQGQTHSTEGVSTHEAASTSGSTHILATTVTTKQPSQLSTQPSANTTATEVLSTGHPGDGGCFDAHPESCQMLCASICEVEGLDDTDEAVGLSQREKRFSIVGSDDPPAQPRLLGWLWGNPVTTRAPTTTTVTTVAPTTTTTTTTQAPTTPHNEGLSLKRCKKMARLADHVILTLCPKSCDVCGRHTNRARLAQCYVRANCHLQNHL